MQNPLKGSLSRAMRLGLATTIASLGFVGAANAATVSVTSGVLTYAADAGHFNDPVFSNTGSDVTVTRFGGSGDDDPLVNGTDCEAPVDGGGGTQSVVCHGVTSVVANTSDLGDSPSAGGLTLPITENGGDGDDNLTGGSADAGDALNGENGNDQISGLGGPDKISGGPGNDGTFFAPMDGDAGNDTIDGGPGDDTVADTGNPTTPAPATPGVNDTSNDTITGGDGDDSLNGGAGDDNVDGQDGSDSTLVGGLGTDTVSGGNGNDQVFATEDGAADTYNGGSGTDTIDYSGYFGAVTLALTGGEIGAEKDKLAADFENATGGAGDDVLTGSEADNQLIGNDGNDTVNGAGGNDGLSGNAGNDTLNGGEGRDLLQGFDGNDTLNGENGDDSLQGGNGDDVYNGGAGVDTADFSDHGSNVTVTLDGTANDGSSGEVDNADADKQVENVLTGFGDDTVTGNSLANFVDSGPGNDVINVADGSLLTDIVSCGTGFDQAAGDVLDAFDRSGSTRCEIVPKAKFKRVSAGVSAKVTPKSDKKAPFKFRTRGKITPPAAVGDALGCDKGSVVVQVKAGANTISTRRASVHDDCTYSSSVTLHVKKRFFGHNQLRFVIRYSGNRFLKPKTLKTKHVNVG